MYSVSVSKRRRRHSTLVMQAATSRRPPRRGSRYRSGRRLALGQKFASFRPFHPRRVTATKIDSCFERAPTAVTGSSRWRDRKLKILVIHCHIRSESPVRFALKARVIGRAFVW
ncbi:hypothetical protein EVAR_100656_1 [Eumeta japonica]|uniref:Uncharacterized protein n=1 Tax=Eumeta variegata TaxID=151549 RepID=A0A4C1ZN50_EUMVA|nr:hypothetical protein EVAR_100656_1 [Eumeta japonica]